ncbi:MAG: hypothetical protein RR709_10195 [Ruthenibacterium sp.]
MLKNVLNEKKLLYSFVAIAVLFVGIVTAVIAIGGYFGYMLFEVVYNENNNKYLAVVGLVVSKESEKRMLSNVSTYRVVPVDESGDFIDENGSLDFFLSLDASNKKRNGVLLIGATYFFVFAILPDDSLSERNLFVKKRISGNSSALQQKSGSNVKIYRDAPIETEARAPIAFPTPKQ